ncbi:MAG TPA: glycosyltransferase family 4 protein [Gemmatimonadales bacterium]|nr:glycosyltransferase family 4 protein [Gemmatimonadales bacterium]
MRAVIVSHTYIDPATRGKLRALAGLGCTLSVAIPDRWSPTPRGPLLEASWGNDGGVRMVPIPVKGDRGEGVSWKVSDLARMLSDFRPDVVHIEAEPWTPAAAAASARAQKLNIPVILFAWESVVRSETLRERWRRKRTLDRAKGLIGGNQLAAALLARGRSKVPVTVVPQLGLTPPLEIQRPSNAELTIGFVGRLVPEKGLDTLFRACVKLLGRWTLTVVGSGPAQEQLEALAERLGIASRITWKGPMPAEHLRELWPQVDCLVVPSRTTPHWVETFHPAMVEAMGHGVTVVASDSGALPELVDTAGLVVPEDDVPALTAALQHLADAPRERARLGKEARLRVMAEYVDNAVARRTLEFWEKVVGKK